MLGCAKTRRRIGTSGLFYTFDLGGSVAQRWATAGYNDYAFDAYGRRAVTLSGDYYTGCQGQWGGYFDSDLSGDGRATGPVWLGRRFYDPAGGRFLTRDPSGYGGGADLYAYCGDDPVNLCDPTGLNPQSDGGDGGRDFANTLADFFGGFGSTASFGLTDWINRQSGADSVIDKNSPAYHGGQVSGVIVQTLATSGSGGEAEAVEQTGLHGPCFIAGTAIQMDNGKTQFIEKVKRGDRVESRNAKTGQIEVKVVVRAFVHHVPRVLALHLASAVSGKVVQTLTCTPQHLFYVTDQGFVPAGLLAIGAKVVTRSGIAMAVQSVEKQRNPKNVSQNAGLRMSLR